MNEYVMHTGITQNYVIIGFHSVSKKKNMT